jgi:hypothetical protein
LFGSEGRRKKEEVRIKRVRRKEKEAGSRDFIINHITSALLSFDK